MPLDNAQFISELSITDPEGTDPLNQGDDQIRTTKRATQQSFPNIDAAVPQTAAQMAQMAIKNETNTFTQVNTFQQGPIFQGGSVYDSGGTSQISFDKSGVRQWQISYSGTSDNIDIRRFLGGSLVDAPIELIQASGLAQFARGILNRGGAVGDPTYSFTGDATTGMFRDTAGRISFQSSGALKFLIQSDQVQALTPFRSVDGTEAAPGYGFASDNGTGMYASATSCNLAANGFTIASFTSSSDIFAAVGRSWAANSDRLATRPGFNFNADSDTGFYNPNPNTIGFAAAGVSVGTWDNTAIWTANGVSVHGDGASSQSNPAFAFTNDTDTGMFRRAANSIGWAVGAADTMWLLGGTVSSTLNLNQTAGTGAGYNMFQNGVLRWGMGGAGNNQETWNVTRFNDAGGFLNNPISVLRADGVITLNNIPTVNPGGTNRLWKSSGFVAIT